MIDSTAMKGKQTIIPCIVQSNTRQLHSNQTGVKKTILLVRESVHWLNVNVDIENTVKQCATCLEYKQIQSLDSITFKILFRPWNVVAADVFMVDNKMLLCIVDNYSMFPIVKKVGSRWSDTDGQNDIFCVWTP